MKRDCSLTVTVTEPLRIVTVLFVRADNLGPDIEEFFFLGESHHMPVRGLRGAITVGENSAEEILSASRELLVELIRVNDLTDFTEIVSAVFTTTPDLTATFPAEAARSLGMHHVPLLCASEIAVPHGMPRCLRVLLHVNTEKTQLQMVHVYLRDAKKLRPDMTSAQ